MSRLLSLLGSCSLLVAVAGCAAPAPAQAPGCAAAPQHAELQKMSDAELARKLVDVVLGKQLIDQMMDNMTQSLSKLPSLPPGFMDRFRQNLKAEELIEMIVPIYQRSYERDTMIAAIEFYQSEQGRKLIQKQPEAMRLGMEAGQQWGRQIAKKTLEEMGIVVPPTGGS